MTLTQLIRAEDLFGELEREEESELERNPEVIKNERLEKLCRIYEEFVNAPDEDISSDRDYYSIILKDKLKGRKFSSKEIKDISAVLSKYQDDEPLYAGIFLSRLINDSDDSRFIIFTNQFADKLHYLGMFNKKDIKIIGSVGDFLGMNMRTGRIAIFGDTGVNTGFQMNNGIININGSCRYNTGREATGGSIHVYGDFSDFKKDHLVDGYMNGASLFIHNPKSGWDSVSVGDHMKNGLVKVSGDAYNVGTSMAGGEVYVNGDIIGSVGQNMEDGKIEVNGNCTWYNEKNNLNIHTGCMMTGGNITINSNAGNVGCYMNNGRITVNGTVFGSLGGGMRGGRIDLNGNHFGIPNDIEGGDIYHNGVQIVKDGKLVE